MNVIEKLVIETNEVLPSWGWMGFPQHPAAQIIQYSETPEAARETLKDMASDCRHQIGWIEAKGNKYPIEKLVLETNRVLPSWWKSFHFPQHPVAQIIQLSKNINNAKNNLEAMASDCMHQVGWINGTLRNRT